MRISTKLKITPVLIGIFAMVLGIIFVVMYHKMDDIRRMDNATNEVAQGIGELNILTYDYLHRPSERAQQQWLGKQASLKRLVSGIKTDQKHSDHLDRIATRLDGMRPLFEEIVSLKHEDDGAEVTVNRQLGDRLTNNLLMTSQSVISDSYGLNDDYHTLGLALQKRLILAIMITTVLLGGVMSWIAFSMNKNVLGSLEALQQAAGIIGAGNLGHRIRLATQDELSELGDSFNLMAEQIESSLEEKVLLEDQLHQAQKMEAIGTLAGGVAHDFNNILTAIVGYATLASLELPAGSAPRNDIDQILLAAERAAGLTRSLLAFSRKETVELKAQDLNGIVIGFQKMLHRLLDEDIELTVDCTPGELVVKADKGQIEQVLMNLVTNARDAMPQGGTIHIATSAALLEQEAEDLAPGAYAIFSVSDNGSGMDPETLKRIFDPFYTTKGVSQGTGLGLSIVYGVTGKHMGAIRVASELGRGTRFTVYLPLLPEGAKDLAQRNELPVPTGTETLLLIEDDAAVRESTRQILEGYGYSVVTAVDGDEGVSRFRENEERIALVLSDILMPKKNGLEMLAAIREIRGDAKVIFTSGYTADILERRGIVEDGLVLLRKPLNPGDLLRKIREVLAVQESQ